GPITYEGYAAARFADPPGLIRGRVFARYTEAGDSEVTMSADEVLPEGAVAAGHLMEFVARTAESRDGGNVVTVYRHADPNPCLDLTVSLPEGVLTSNGPAMYDWSVGTSSQLSFWSSSMTMDALDQEAPAYWVFPLVNFRADFPYSLSMKDHPMRVRRGPVAESDGDKVTREL